MAVSRGHVDIVAKLTEAGANMDLPNKVIILYSKNYSSAVVNQENVIGKAGENMLIDHVQYYHVASFLGHTPLKLAAW